MINATIITPQRVLFEGKAHSLFFPGTTGEFEILEFHKPIISRLKAGGIIIDNEKRIPIRGGAMRVISDELVALVEE